MACRDVTKADAARDRLLQAHPDARIETMTLDLADLASTRRFADAFAQRHGALDLLFNNASAIMVPPGRAVDSFETHLGTNHLGAFALTGLLLPRLRAGARVINTASIAHRMTPGLDLNDPWFERRTYKEMHAYGQSKLATLLFAFELDRRLRRAGHDIRAVAAHPGYAATNADIGNVFMRPSTRLFAQPPAQGAWPALYAATADDAQRGDYFGPGGFKELRGHPARVGCRDEARDPELARRLWDWSQAPTGVNYLQT